MRRYADQYQHVQVMTASSGQLLLLTYQGALRFLREGAAAMQRQDLSAQSRALIKAQRLLRYLQSTLNHEANPELAGNLDRIYTHLVNRLMTANVQDDLAAVQEVTQMVSELYAAWEEAEARGRGIAPAAAAVAYAAAGL